MKKYFEKLTKYKVDLHYMPNWFVISYIFFGFLMFVFYKRIKEYRKQYYMVNQIKYIEWYKLYHDYDYDDEKYYNFKRYLKIKKVKGELLVKYQ
jgi:hypothetical protein